MSGEGKFYRNAPAIEYHLAMLQSGEPGAMLRQLNAHGAQGWIACDLQWSDMNGEWAVLFYRPLPVRVQ